MELTGRVAVVTGAASGIGLGLCERFVADGMSVVMADVEAPRLDAEVARLQAIGTAALGVRCNVGDPEQVAALRDAALARFGAVHLLCNNAGVAAGRPNVRTSPAVWRWMVDVNLLVAYRATTYAVVGLSESLHLELAGTGVGVSCLCPEPVDTRVFESTRNAPPSTGLRPPPHVPIDQIAQLMGTSAMPPAQVAAAVVEAIRAERFWVITHDVTRARIRRRNAALEAERNPTPV